MPYPIYIILNDAYYKKKITNKDYKNYKDYKDYQELNKYTYILQYTFIKNLQNKYERIESYIKNIKNKK